MCLGSGQETRENLINCQSVFPWTPRFFFVYTIPLFFGRYSGGHIGLFLSFSLREGDLNIDFLSWRLGSLGALDLRLWPEAHLDPHCRRALGQSLPQPGAHLGPHCQLLVHAPAVPWSSACCMLRAVLGSSAWPHWQGKHFPRQVTGPAPSQFQFWLEFANFINKWKWNLNLNFFLFRRTKIK